MTAIGFADLYDGLTAAGLSVGVELSVSGHVLTIVDPDRNRVIHYPVKNARFDNVATTVVFSAQLRERFTPASKLNVRTQSGRLIVIGAWPEFDALWPFASTPETDA